MNNLNEEMFKYVGQCTAEHYNQFFNPNLCHVCKSVDRGNLILCDRCCLISYCGEEHRTLHFTEHKDLCTIIAQTLQVRPQKDIRRFNNWQQWIQSRKELMQLIQEKFDRPMEPYMQQMILWSKSCIVCHQQTELRVCERCFSTNYCNEHEEDFKRNHEEFKCDQLMLSLNIDIETISGNTNDVSTSFLSCIFDIEYCEEIHQFCLEYLIIPKVTPKEINWSAKDYVQSDYLSEPLTVYYVSKEVVLIFNALNLKSTIIHIIAANSVDLMALPAWEILLHLFPNIQNLLIILIGPGLKNRYKQYRLCERCRHKNNELSSLSYSETYHDYTSSTIHRPPNIIVGFHVEFSEEHFCSKSVKAVAKATDCPLILGFSCREKAQYNIHKLQNVLTMSSEPVINRRNNFVGFAPHRDLEADGAYFRNGYVVVFDYLYNFPSDDSSNSAEDSSS